LERIETQNGKAGTDEDEREQEEIGVALRHVYDSTLNVSAE
jgi:hypothetical protein